MRRIAFHELVDPSRAERVAVHVLGGRARSIFEWLLMAFETALSVGARDPIREVRPPFGRAVQIGPGDAGEALAATDVGAGAVEGVELRGEQLVADLERLQESFMTTVLRDERIELGLIAVLGHRIVHDVDLEELGTRDDRPRHGPCQHQKARTEKHHGTTYAHAYLGFP